MTPAKRIVVNTLAQHIRSILNTLLSLYSTRLVLQALGQYDYGVYMLVGGVVAMLGFITNAMVVTTQRHLSFLHGRGDMDKVKQMFSNSLLLHIVLGVLLAIALIAVKPMLFNGFLDIEPTRLDVAGNVYLIVTLSLLLTFITAPYRALFIARENIVYISVVDVLDGVVKLLAALWLLHCSYDRLIAYAWIVAGIMALNWFALAIGSKIIFTESRLIPNLKDISRDAMKQLFGFAGWTIYSMGCIIGRNQGIAILLNQFFGAIINSAYGIANQVFSAISFIAQSIFNAMNPQIIKAEGQGDRSKTLHLATLSSKYTFLLLSLATIPLVFEMPAILQLWLGNVPEYTVLLCRFILITALLDKLTLGLDAVNQAIGKIRNYSLLINTPKFLTLLFMWIALRHTRNVYVAMWCYLTIEVICTIVRLIFIKVIAGLSITYFIKNAIVPLLLPTLVQLILCTLVIQFVPAHTLRFVITGLLSASAATVVSWFFTLNANERKTTISMLPLCR